MTVCLRVCVSGAWAGPICWDDRLCRDMAAPMETMVDDAPGSTLHDNGIEDGAELYLYAVQPGAADN